MSGPLFSQLGVQIRTGLLIVGVLCLVSGCASSSTLHSPEPSNPALETQLRETTADWEGVPYRLGGLNRSGIDCSGFVQMLVAETSGETLPRTTERQATVGTEVHRNALSTGDLVFFRTGRKTRHVGVYLSNGEFAHASTSRGVMISHLGEPYWTQRYWTARRLGIAPVPPSQPAPQPRPTRRAGW